MYLPYIRPDAPSVLRQLAYQERTSIPGPEIDPDGWKSLDPFLVKGQLLGARSVEAMCALSIAKQVW